MIKGDRVIYVVDVKLLSYAGGTAYLGIGPRKAGSLAIVIALLRGMFTHISRLSAAGYTPR